MKEFSIAGKKYILVEVPENGTNFFINNIGVLRCKIMHGTVEEGHVVHETIDKYLGDHEILSLLSDLTEEMAAGIVPVFTKSDRCGDPVYPQYENKLSGTQRRYFESSLDSFRSFLRSIGVDESKNFLILKEI